MDELVIAFSSNDQKVNSQLELQNWNLPSRLRLKANPTHKNAENQKKWHNASPTQRHLRPFSDEYLSDPETAGRRRAQSRHHQSAYTWKPTWKKAKPVRTLGRKRPSRLKQAIKEKKKQQIRTRQTANFKHLLPSTHDTGWKRLFDNIGSHRKKTHLEIPRRWSPPRSGD